MLEDEIQREIKIVHLVWLCLCDNGRCTELETERKKSHAKHNFRAVSALLVNDVYKTDLL